MLRWAFHNGLGSDVYSVFRIDVYSHFYVYFLCYKFPDIDSYFCGVLIFIYGMIQLGFKSESIPAKKYLAKLLEAEIEEIANK